MRISDWSSDVCSSDLGIIPLQFLKAVLPEPASLGETTRGKTNIGDIATGQKDGQQKTFYIYNVCDHEDAYAETGNQAVSYTTGVPAMIGAAMILTGAWEGKGVFKDRKRVVQGKRVSVRVDIGGRRSIKKKKRTTQQEQL